MYVFIFGEINGHNGYWVLRGAGVDVFQAYSKPSS